MKIDSSISAVITGGASGLGAATARRLAQRDQASAQQAQRKAGHGHRVGRYAPPHQPTGAGLQPRGDQGLGGTVKHGRVDAGIAPSSHPA